MIILMRLELREEPDLVHCRQRARQIAKLLEMDSLQQTQFSTAVSEIARNALRYAGSAKVNFSLRNEMPLKLEVKIKDQGPGIPDIAAAVASPQGMGLKGAHRLMDDCAIESSAGAGTAVTLVKIINRVAPLTAAESATLIDKLLLMRPSDAMSEVRLQNSELLLSLEEAKKQQEVALGYQRQLEALNKELADTNRGVIALNIELEDQAKRVKDASEVKARFLSHVTHEFRTPVNSMLSMSRILLTSASPLDADQKKQISFIRQAAEGLSEMVNDLLDTVKADAGRMTVMNSHIQLSEIFDTLRAMFRPLIPTDRRIELVIEDNENIPTFISDETKISQILRNFISNSLKFTEDGQIHVQAGVDSGGLLRITVHDTGIGIADEHQGMIFEEFMQVQGPHQRLGKGTGLGLPLARKLARLLDGEVHVASSLGKGSSFSLTLPLRVDEGCVDPAPNARRILMIDDDPAQHYILQNAVNGFQCDTAYALNGREGLGLAASFLPDLIVLDVRMPGMDGFEVLGQLKENPLTQSIPVLLNSTIQHSMDEFPELGKRPAAILMKGFYSRDAMLRQIRKLLQLADRKENL